MKKIILKRIENKKFILKNFRIASIKLFNSEETVEKILKDKCSIARYGDGEFKIIYGRTIGFQKYDKELARRLYEILHTNDEKFLVGMMKALKFNVKKMYTEEAAGYWTRWLKRNRIKVLKTIDTNKTYYSANITRFYMDYIDKSNKKQYVEKLKKIWEDRDLTIIEGEQSRLGIGNDLFKNAKSIERILCPATESFDKYSEIFEEAKKTKKNNLILIALGPTATVLAYDLYKCGYQALDIGHVDVEYEWFVRNAVTKIKLENKYVNEAGGYTEGSVLENTEYFNQIRTVVK